MKLRSSEMEPRQEVKSEFAVVDESCNCRRIIRTLAGAQAIMEKGTIWTDGRQPGTLHIEVRQVSDWKRL